jgi:acyl carrier protein
VIVPDDQIQGKVIELIADQTGKGADTIKPATHLHNDLKMDDLDDVRLVMQLEDTFGFAIPDDDAKRLTTVAAISDYIKFRRSAK